MAGNHRAARIGNALVGLGLFLLVGLGAWWGERHLREGREHREKVRQARDLVHRAAHCPDADFPEALQARDPWHNALVVRKIEGTVSCLLILSKGPDGLADTADDLRARRDLRVDWNLAGRRLGTAGGDLGRGLVQGLFRSAVGRADPGKSAP